MWPPEPCIRMYYVVSPPSLQKHMEIEAFVRMGFEWCSMHIRLEMNSSALYA